MTFGAMAAWQAWLLIAAALAVACALFLVKLRPPRVLVPSLVLWRKVLDESRELTLWERIRRAVSLALTLLIAAALALGVTRPGRTAGAADVAAGRLLIVLDSSWSMQARTSSGETRWERAVAEARRLLAAASGGEVALATTADGLVEGPTSDGSLVDATLDRLAPGGGQGTAWPRLTGASAVHFVTDGATPRPLDSTVIVHSVFEPADNVGITAFHVRPSLTPGNAGDAYLEISNFATTPQQVRLTVSRGESAVFNRELEVGGGQALRQVVPVSRGGPQALVARVQAPEAHNALPLDDEAVIWVDRARPLAVTVVGAQTAWLRSALEHDADVRATFIAPDRYSVDAVGRDDVVIFDRWAPAEAPVRPALLFAPPPSTPWLTAPPPDALPGVPTPTADERRPRWETAGAHPVVLGVDPFTLTIERARRYPTPSLQPVALSTRGTPLVSINQTSGSRWVVVGFGPDDSNLPAAPGFPVLLGNAFEWLARPPAALARTPADGSGSPLVREALEPGLTRFDGGIVRVSDPKGDGVHLWRVNDSVVAVLRTPGLYVAEGGGARSTLAVNVGTPQLSNLQRAPSFPAGRTRAVTSGASPRPWWLYCTFAAFLLCLAEWWTWQRRITV